MNEVLSNFYSFNNRPLYWLSIYNLSVNVFFFYVLGIQTPKDLAE